MSASERPRDPSDAQPPTPWLRLGRLLPAALRTRVFEPAYYDLLADHPPAQTGAPRFGLRVIVLALETYRVGGPRLALDTARSSRRAWLFISLALLAIVAFLLLNGGTAAGPTPYYQPAAGP